MQKTYKIPSANSSPGPLRAAPDDDDPGELPPSAESALSPEPSAVAAQILIKWVKVQPQKSRAAVQSVTVLNNSRLSAGQCCIWDGFGC